MKKTLLAAAAVTTILAANISTAQAEGKNGEKCFGVAKAGKNDCATSNTACAGTSKADGQKDAWLYLPKGVCEKLSGGHLASADMKKDSKGM